MSTENAPTALVLHGGGGPATVAGLATHLAKTMTVMAPTHPGWNGTDLGDISSVADIAAHYLHMLKAKGATNTLLVGSSLGGWIATEMALQDHDGQVGGLVLINAAGIAVDGEPIANVFAMTPREITEHSFHAPDAFHVDPASLPPERIAAQGGNMATMQRLAGEPYMHDPSLRARLWEVKVPTLVIWGEADRIVTPAYGKAFADAIPGARFTLIKDAGHLPQIEQPAATYAEIDRFSI